MVETHKNSSKRTVIDVLNKEFDFSVDDIVTESARQSLEQEIISRINQIVREKVDTQTLAPLRATFGDLKSSNEELCSIRDSYVKLAGDYAEGISAFFSDSSKNLDSLEAVSADIRDEVIDPSFSMFEKRKVQLLKLRSELESIELT